MSKTKGITSVLHGFDSSGIQIPKTLKYPINYYPDQLAINAANDLQKRLLESEDKLHDFFNLKKEPSSGGKMIGVLVVKTPIGGLKYISAFSGNLGGKTVVDEFVSPIFDIQDSSNFIQKEEQEISDLNQKYDLVRNDNEYQNLLKERDVILNEGQGILNILKDSNNKKKAERKKLRSSGLNQVDIEKLNRESANDKIQLRKFKQVFDKEKKEIENKLKGYQEKLVDLEKERKRKSVNYQNKIFESYILENSLGEKKNMLEVFKEYNNTIPPSASGECAAPKLFQFAIKHNLKPIALAEFWWGEDSPNDLRKHKEFYPACKAKCEPILDFILKGLRVEENPLLSNMTLPEIPILFEDQDLLIINKPEGVLSVPGTTELPSIENWFRKKYNIPAEPVMIHRLDMATSGVLVLAKNKNTHKFIQQQFIDKSIKKEYTALLDGIVQKESGKIILPLITNFNDRPRQKVCYDHGKYAETDFDIIGIEGELTRIKFHPITGRTHQLRVHSAHSKGLNTAIVGDDLYGKKAKRLMLHSSYIKFVHPRSKSIIEISSKAEF